MIGVVCSCAAMCMYTYTVHVFNFCGFNPSWMINCENRTISFKISSIMALPQTRVYFIHNIQADMFSVPPPPRTEKLHENTGGLSIELNDPTIDP